VRTRPPTLKDMETALVGVWLGHNLHVAPLHFRAIMRVRAREAIASDWAGLAGIQWNYVREERKFVEHLKTHPEVYGDSTPEMIERFEKLARGHLKKAGIYWAWCGWIRCTEIPRELLEFDMTGSRWGPSGSDWTPRDEGQTWSGLPPSSLPKKYWLRCWLTEEELSESPYDIAMRAGASDAMEVALIDLHCSDLEGIEVLWRQPDTLSLWGIPHGMRPGQSPRDLWEAGNVSGWVWLGAPGWWGTASTFRRTGIERFMTRFDPGAIPGGPYEWITVEDAMRRSA